MHHYYWPKGSAINPQAALEWPNGWNQEDPYQKIDVWKRWGEAPTPPRPRTHISLFTGMEIPNVKVYVGTDRDYFLQHVLVVKKDYELPIMMGEGIDAEFDLYRDHLNLYRNHLLPLPDFPVLKGNLPSDFHPKSCGPVTTKAERNAQRSDDAWFLRYGEIKPVDLDDEEEDWFEHEYMKNNWFDLSRKEDTGFGTRVVDVRTYNGRTKNIWHYTHDLFSAEKFRRCRGQFIDDFVPPKNCIWEAHKSTCWGCEYAVETNLKERVLGLDHIIFFMRWPVVCRLTFANVPVPNMPISATELSRQFRSMRSLGYPSWSHPTIKKWMNEPQNQIGRDRIGRIAVLGSQWFIKLTKRYWIDYGSYLDFMHTPVDSLLRKYPVEGAHALISLSKVPDKWIPPGQTELVDFKTTGQNLIDLLGQKSFNLLNANLSASGRIALVAHGRTSGILFKIDPIGVKQSELYFARPYFYRQYPGLNQQYKDYQNEFWFELIITIQGGRFH